MSTQTSEASQVTAQEALRRWPRLVAHMICESLGYFSPMAAAAALAAYKQGEPYACEWYYRRGQGQGRLELEQLLRVGQEVVQAAFQFRGHHTGCMADYHRASMLVEEAGRSPAKASSALASWF